MNAVLEQDELDKIRDRIFRVVEQENLSNVDFASIIDVGPAVISHLRSGRNKVSLNVCLNLLKSFPHLNPDWLFHGKGDMYRNIAAHGKNNLSSPQAQGDLFRQTATETANPSENKSFADESIVEHLPQEEVAVKKVQKILLFYDDNSYQEFTP